MVVSLSALRTGRLYPQEIIPGTQFCYRLSRPQGHSAVGRILYQSKIPMTDSGIEPATLRFVAQHLNHCPHFRQWKSILFVDINIIRRDIVWCIAPKIEPLLK